VVRNSPRQVARYALSFGDDEAAPAVALASAAALAAEFELEGCFELVCTSAASSPEKSRCSLFQRSSDDPPCFGGFADEEGDPPATSSCSGVSWTGQRKKSGSQSPTFGRRKSCGSTTPTFGRALSPAARPRLCSSSSCTEEIAEERDNIDECSAEHPFASMLL